MATKGPPNQSTGLRQFTIQDCLSFPEAWAESAGSPTITHSTALEMELGDGGHHHSRFRDPGTWSLAPRFCVLGCFECVDTALSPPEGQPPYVGGREEAASRGNRTASNLMTHKLSNSDS